MKLNELFENWHPSQPRPQKRYYMDATEQQQVTLDNMKEYNGEYDILALSDNVYDTGNSNFYDFEPVPGIKGIRLDDIGPFDGYNSSSDREYISKLAENIKENGISPIIVGLDKDGSMYVVEGQHRARAFVIIGESIIPAKVLIDLDITDEEYEKYKLKKEKEQSIYNPKNDKQTEMPFESYNIPLLERQNNRPLVVVDVQPAYEKYIGQRLINDLAELINSQSGKIIMYVNADDTVGDENIRNDIIPWWYEIFENNGLDTDKIDEFEFIDKGYGHIRELMDSGVGDNVIIKIIRDMYQQKVHDSRYLYNEDEEKIKEVYGDEVGELLLNGAYVSWLELGKLKSLSPFYICGGGRNECLKEVLLMLNAFNIRYKVIEKFVY